PGGVVGGLRRSGGGLAGGAVCARRAPPTRVGRCGDGGPDGLGTGQDRIDRRHAGGGAAAGAGPELAGPAGRHGGGDENVLGRAAGAPRCPTNRLTFERRVVRWPQMRMHRLQVNTSFTTCSTFRTSRNSPSSTSRW